MKKSLILTLLILSSLLLFGCGQKDNKKASYSSNTISSSNASNKDFTLFTLTDTTLYTTPFVSSINSTIFPNWSDNNKISIIKDPLPKDIIKTSDILDFFDYSTSSLATKGDEVYFADASSSNCLASVNLVDKTYKKLSTSPVEDIIINDNEILYRNQNTKNIYSYDLSSNNSKLVIQNKVGKYIVNGDFILYENQSDSSKLYKVKIDGEQNESLTNFSVNSFAPYENQILAINSSDNNNLYLINPSDLKSTRISLMNGEDLKVFDNKLYFVNLDDNNYLYSLKIDLNTSAVSFDPVLKEGINEFYPTSNGIFVQKRINVNNTYIIPLSK